MGPSILLFTGHLLDKIDRESSRFPYRLIREVKTLIEIELERIVTNRVPAMAISSLAAGGDMLFASEIIRREIPLTVFLPHEKEKFLADSVRYLKDLPSEDPKEWEDHFHENIAKASRVVITQSNGLRPDQAYAACNDAMLAFALELAQREPSKVLALALVKNIEEIKPGGSADFVTQIQSTGIKVKKIWPSRSNKLYC